MKLTIAICDDESIYVNHLCQLIQAIAKNFSIPIDVICFDDPLKLVNNLLLTEYQLIFLDILMKEQNGIAIAHQIRTLSPDVPIVFVTSTADYALKGYDVHAKQYLLKPATEAQVAPIIQKVWETHLKQNQEFFLLETRTLVEKIPLHTIEYFEVFNRIIKIHTPSMCYEFYGKLNELEEDLSIKGFLRCHRSYLVNISAIKQLQPKTLVVNSGKQLPISRTKIEEVKLHILSKKRLL